MATQSPVSNGRVGCLKHKIHWLDPILAGFNIPYITPIQSNHGLKLRKIKKNLATQSPVSNGRVGCLKHKIHWLDPILAGFNIPCITPNHRLLMLFKRPFSRPIIYFKRYLNNANNSLLLCIIGSSLEELGYQSLLVKFSFFEKATKICAIFLMIWTFTY